MFEQERFIGRLQRQVQADPAIKICFLSGSFGRRTEDAYSDVDIALVYDSAAERDRAWAARADLVRAVMPYVGVRAFDADHVRPFLHVALYSNGTKADYRYETKDSLQPNPWDREIRILKDDGLWAEQFQSAASRLAFPQPYISLSELTALDNRFWVMLWDVLRILRRGDTEKPFTVYLELLSGTLPPLLGALPPEDPAYRGLLRAFYSQDAAETRRGLGELLDAYLAARAAVVRRGNLAYIVNTAFESEARRQIDKLVRQ